MSEQAKQILAEIEKLPPEAQDAILQQVRGAILMMEVAKKSARGGRGGQSLRRCAPPPFTQGRLWRADPLKGIGGFAAVGGIRPYGMNQL